MSSENNFAFQDIAEIMVWLQIDSKSYMEKRISCCLSVTVGVCWRQIQPCKCIGDLVIVFGFTDMFQWVLGAQWCSGGVSEDSVHAGSSLAGDKPTKFGTTSKGEIVFSWRFQDIEISKPPYVSFPKMVGFFHFMWFWHLSQRNYNWQSYWITL